MKEKNSQKFLAIDYGTKRIGLAISQGPLAIPLTVISYQSVPELIDKIKKICHDEQVTQIIMGISENEIAQKTRQFTQQLKKELAIPLVYADETLSSEVAKQRLRSRKKPLPSEIDHYAAAYILEQWLETQ